MSQNGFLHCYIRQYISPFRDIASKPQIAFILNDHTSIMVNWLRFVYEFFFLINPKSTYEAVDKNSLQW